MIHADRRTDKHDEANSRFPQYLRTRLTTTRVVLAQMTHVLLKICHIIQNLNTYTANMLNLKFYFLSFKEENEDKKKKSLINVTTIKYYFFLDILRTELSCKENMKEV